MLIHFLVSVCSRALAGTSAPHAHPAAPAELKAQFSDFVKKFEASTSSPTTNPVQSRDKGAFPEFWEAPERFWRPRTRTIEDFEIDAIQVSLGHCSRSNFVLTGSIERRSIIILNIQPIHIRIVDKHLN